ncbi:uncharacterized protein LOC112054704 [Bicyclus anynana]|uniref:Uncharacterized protein LOC112054704 n=1 Tax=Bicyclus anynana TaxID=110368 RepID=A0A6J1NUC6_BICAN|nr:uncharacterized protein LOC112054704 [Bicyclus anynana]
MAKKKIEVFVNIENEQQFEYILNHNQNILICADVYNSFAGPCTALDQLFVKIKLDWSDGNMLLLRVLIDEIESLSRFHDQSEPVFLFIVNRKITRVFRGVDHMRFAQAAKFEIDCFNQYQKGNLNERVTYNLDEASPEEMEWHKSRILEKQKEESSAEARRQERQAARKRHRAERMIPYLQHLNFVLYWPHMVHAHPELYERWDQNNIIMVGREEVRLSEEMAYDVLYAGDAELNEASLYTLLSAPALAICFRLLDTDKHFVSLVRKILYEEVTPIDETKPLKDQNALKTAFDTYKTYSSSREEILRKRKENRLKQKEEVIEKRARRLSEIQRLARQAIADGIQAKRAAKENRRIELLKTGNLSALENLNQESDDDDVNIVIPEVLPDVEVEDEEETDDENEYFPPAGLLIPGFYAPPNDVAKTNGLAILFPKLVSENVTPEDEFLPPHVLVMFDMDKRYKAMEVISQYKDEVIHMGIFKATRPSGPVKHIAYSIKQFDVMAKRKTYKLEKLKLALMISIKKDLALLELVGIGPTHVSRDVIAGEVECAVLFSVDYGDNYPQFEDFEIY